MRQCEMGAVSSEQQRSAKRAEPVYIRIMLNDRLRRVSEVSEYLAMGGHTMRLYRVGDRWIDSRTHPVRAAGTAESGDLVVHGRRPNRIGEVIALRGFQLLVRYSCGHKGLGHRRNYYRIEPRSDAGGEAS